MKEKDLFVDFKQREFVYFVEKDDKSFGPIISGSHLSKNYLDDFYTKKRKLELSLRQQVLDNEISPIYYYMLLQELAPADLAARVSISLRKLKRYFKPKHFALLSMNMLSKFAEVFNIPVYNFLNLIIVKDDDRVKLLLEFQQGKNELFTITKISTK